MKIRSSGVRASVIVPCLDTPTVDMTVAALGRQTGASPHEILVVGRDRQDRLRGHPEAELIATPEPVYPGAARNIGAGRASGDILVFVDADCEPEPDWLEAHLRRHAAGQSVVGGSVLWDETNYWTAADNLSMFHEFVPTAPAGPRPFLASLNLSVAASTWRAVGEMDPTLRCGEDVDWSARAAAAGYSPWFEPEARVWHRPPRTTARSMLEHWHRSGAWMVGVRERHPEAFSAPSWLYRRWVLAALGPAIAVAAAARIFAPGKPGWRRPAAFPAVLATKLAWCVGGLRASRACEFG